VPQHLPKDEDVKMRLLLLVAACWVGCASTGAAATSDACLLASELSPAARMASIMAMGVAVQHCRRCLSPQDYQQTLAKYESLGLLQEFWAAQKLFGAPETAKSNYVDDVVRQAARLSSEKLSSKCEACSSMAATIDGLGSPQERDRFYDNEARELASSPLVRMCP
jgi:hypothetical protein